MNNKKIVILNILSFFAFWVVAILFHLGLTTGFDSSVYEVISPFISETTTKIMIIITELGSTTFVVIMCVLLLIIPKTRKEFGLPISVTVIFSCIINFVLKNLFLRERPDVLRLVEVSGYSFPSGHSMNNMTLYTILILLLLALVKDSVKSRILILSIFIIPVLIGFSRIYLGVHYPSDVLAGLLAGFWVGSLMFLLYNRFILKNKV